MGRTRRIPTPAIQGDDSWIEIIPLTWGESRALAGMTGNEVECLVCRHVTAWNWVDGGGAALPQPDGGPAMLDALTEDEVKALVRTVINADERETWDRLRDESATYFWTRVGNVPDEETELMLCRLYSCPPSVLDEQDADRVMRHLIVLGAKAKAGRL